VQQLRDRISDRVLAFRREVEDVFPTPTVTDSLLFLNSECGELNDAYVRFRGEAYCRNRDASADVGALRREIGDMQLMLATFAAHFGIDVETALEETFAKIRERVACG
jgi:NTP pyrophosphatase (non-canonical NTP hydrolase)